MFDIRKMLQATDGRRIRVIDSFREAEVPFVAVIDVDDPTAWPVVWVADDIRSVAKEQRWSELKAAGPQVDPSSARKRVSEHALKLRQERWAIAKNFKGDRRFYRRAHRNSAVQEFAHKFNKSPSFIRDLLRAYYQGGMTEEAVAPKLHRCGRSAHDGRARGRKPSISDYEPFAWTAESHRQALKFCKNVFLKDVTVTYAAVHLKLVKEHYTYLDQDGKPIPLAKGERPSIKQVADLLRKNISIQERQERRESEAEFHNNQAAKLGSALQDTLGPGDVYEIDASQIDNSIVAIANLKLVIGKAIMYLIVDRASRLIVGFFFSLDAPSWASARQAILSIFKDKRELCKRYGVPYQESDWPAHGRMAGRFFGDNAEMLTFGSDALPERLNIDITNARALFSASKGLVECAFKMVHVPLKELDAGYEPARNAKRRRGKKYYENANMTFPQLKRKMLRIIIDHNRSVQKNMALSARDIANGRVAIPLELYRRGVEENTGAGSHFDEQEVLYCLLQEDLGTVKRYGIRVGWLVYSCKEAEDQEWFEESRLRGSFKVKVRVDSGLVNHIYVADRLNLENYFRASLVYSCQKFSGYSRGEVDALMLKHQKDTADALEDDFARTILEMHEDGEAGLLDHFVKPKRSAKKSPAARKAEMRATRSEDVELPDVVEVDGKARPAYEVPRSAVAAGGLDEEADANMAAMSKAPTVQEPVRKGVPVLTGMAEKVSKRYWENDDDLA